MFPVERGNRKRSRHALSPADAAPPLNNTGSGTVGPFRGVVACLTGLPAEEKERIHALIQNMGGRYTRDLNSTQNTHLIASTAAGEKYEAALTFSHIEIVSPVWVDTCARKNARVGERSYQLCSSGIEEDQPTGVDSNKKEQLLSLADELESADMIERRNSVLFSSCHFYIVGFKVDSDVQLQLSRWIRRGLGTIYWEISPSITHIVVNDDCEESVRDAIYALRLQHPNCPVSVSPWWVTSCWKDAKLLPSFNFAPQYRKAPNKVIEKPQKTQEVVSRKAASVFRGTVFVFLRVAPPDGSVDFDSQQLETSIRSHSGQMLSLKIVEALKVDRAVANAKDGSDKRKCYVMCWGGGGTNIQQQITIHPLLSQVKRYDLCELVEVTPVWLYTCCSEERIVGVDRCPILMGPQKWPIHLLAGITGGDKGKSNLRISVTGFSGSRRSAIVHFVKAMGAIYDDSMRTNTTHLICRESTGQKYEKAVEWKLHVVTIDWLYHIARYGYGGENGKSGFGCESQFSFGSTDEVSK